MRREQASNHRRTSGSSSTPSPKPVGEREQVMIVGKCVIDPTATVCEGAIIGKPFRPLLSGKQDIPGGSVVNPKAHVGYYAIVGARSIVGRSTVIDDHCIVESDVELGASTLLIYRAQVCNEVTIGENCVIGGLIGERTRVGNYCRVFG